MSLATRCTSCGTIFRIVEDQLRVSDGWVRCGRCAEIFDARALLFDIERDAPPPWPAPFTPAPVVEPPPPPPPPPPAPRPAPPPPAYEPAWAPAPEPAPEPRIGDDLPTGWPPEDTRHEPRWVDEAPTPAPTAAPAITPPAPPAAVTATQATPPDEPPVPEFIRRAERSARWSRPGVRLALALTSLLLTLLLATQVLVHFRDALAALHPSLRAPLQSLCGALGCTISPWRHIEALSIESTSLNPVGSSGYRLQLALRNKTSSDVATPSVELTLADATGAPFARRVLGPDAFSPVTAKIHADGDQTLTFTFSTNGHSVSGFNVNIFYP